MSNHPCLGGDYQPEMLADDGPVLDLAAKGDHAAQAYMVDHVIACANAGLIPIATALGSAEAFARMAATSGEIRHRQKLGGLLLWQSEHFRNIGMSAQSDIYQVEAVAMMTRLADEGDEDCAALLSTCADAFSPKILKLADDLLRVEDEADSLIGGSETKH